MIWPRPATKDHTVALLPLPPLGWEGEWKGKGRRVGIRAEQQTKSTVTTIIKIRRIYSTNSEMHRAAPTAWCPALPSRDSLPPGELPPSEHRMTSHGIEYPICLASMGQTVSPPGFLWKLTLSWLNPGQPPLCLSTISYSVSLYFCASLSTSFLTFWLMFYSIQSQIKNSHIFYINKQQNRTEHHRLSFFWHKYKKNLIAVNSKEHEW